MGDLGVWRRAGDLSLFHSPGGDQADVHSAGSPRQGELGEPPQSTESKQSDPEFLFVIGFVLCVVGYFFLFF